MKSLMLSLFTTTVAVSISLLFNTGLIKNRSVKTYYQYTSGIYITGIPLGTCRLISLYPCSITYLTDPGVQTFSIYNLPDGVHINSLGIGLMQL